MESFAGILKRMEEAYREESGCPVEAVSDIGLRLRVLAGELYRIQETAQWLKRQIFPQTAEGDELELHGSQRGIARKEAVRAVGEITFTRYIPISFDLPVPKGTVCAAPGEEAVEYETTADVVLLAGEVSVTAPARAVEPGEKGNAAESAVNTLVTPVEGIQYASNRVPFTGGTDREGDEAYRERVAKAYERPVILGNAAYYEEIARSVPGITSAQAVADGENPGTVKIYLWGEGAAPGEETLAAALEILNSKKALGAALAVQAAVEKKINLFLKVALPEGVEFPPAKAAIEKALRAWMAKRQVGDPVQPADVVRLGLEAVPCAVRMEMTASMMGCAATPGVIPVPGTMTAGQIT